MTVNTLIGVAIASAAVSLLGSAHELDRIIAHIELSRSQVAAEVAPAMLIGMLYTYRDVSDAELEAYLSFASTAAGRRYHEAVSRGLNAAYRAAAGELGEQIVDLLYASRHEIQT